MLVGDVASLGAAERPNLVAFNPVGAKVPQVLVLVDGASRAKLHEELRDRVDRMAANPGH
jgi:microcompartment protein CcmK/EutM